MDPWHKKGIWSADSLYNFLGINLGFTFNFVYISWVPLKHILNKIVKDLKNEDFLMDN